MRSSTGRPAPSITLRASLAALPGGVCHPVTVDDTESVDGDRYVVAGYVTSMDNWNEYTPRWYAALKERPRLGYYRTSDALALKGQFERFDEVSRNERLRALAKSIPNKGCLGVMSSISKTDFKEFRSPHPAWNDPYYLCAIWLVVRICVKMLRRPGIEKIDFFSIVRVR